MKPQQFNRDTRKDNGPKINEKITAKSVHLIDAQGRNVGIVPIFQAMQIAADAGLDLVEMNGTQVPPIARVMDYSKFKYEQKKKQSEAKKNQKQTELKEVWIKPLIEKNDFETKMKHAVEFLESGHKVKISAWGRGDKRALRNKDLVNALFVKVNEYLNVALADKISIDAGAKDDRRTSIMVNPKAAK